MWTWVQDHWVIIIAIVSEVLPFIPGKANGIVQSIVSILSKIINKG